MDHKQDDDLEVNVDEEDIQNNYEETQQNDNDQNGLTKQIDQLQQKINSIDQEDDFDYDDLPFHRHFGNNRVFCFIDNEPLFTIGPHWQMNVCMLVTYLVSSLFMITFITIHKSNEVFYGSIGISIINIVLYLLCALMNPGIYTAQREIPDNEIINCEICDVYWSDRNTQHCEICNVCILDFDHHCPWTGKCIGKGNKIYFYGFILMTPLYILYFLVVTLII